MQEAAVQANVAILMVLIATVIPTAWLLKIVVTILWQNVPTKL